MRAGTDAGLVAQLAECVAIPSPTPPGDAAAVGDWVATWCTELGATVRRQEVWPGADNIVATLHFGAGPRLVFNSHLDVVDPSTQRWATPAYEPVQRDGRMYGRGTCDAKGSLVAMISCLERLASDPRGLAGELVLTAVVGEEAGGLGSRRLVRDGFAADAAVVGEPTRMRVARAHKGTYMHRVQFSGRAAHSASPWLGRNAVAAAADFTGACETETDRLATRPHPALGPATMTVTTIEGGTFQNTVPAAATLTVDRRLVPGETHADADRQRERMLGELGRRRPGIGIDVEQIVATVPSETPESAPVVAAALSACAATGEPQDHATGFNAGCDMSKLVGAGVPTVICGPGDLAQAHGPDEFVDLAQVIRAVEVYAHLARTLIGGGAI